MMSRWKDSLYVRLMNRLDEGNFTDDCFELGGSLNGQGYAQVWNPDKSRQMIGSHIVLETIPEGMVRFHTCDNKACLNPLHIVAKTQSENVAYNTGKGRTYTTLQEREEMRRLYSEGVPKLTIAKQLTRSWTCVHFILTRQRYDSV